MAARGREEENATEIRQRKREKPKRKTRLRLHLGWLCRSRFNRTDPRAPEAVTAAAIGKPKNPEREYGVVVHLTLPLHAKCEI